MKRGRHRLHETFAPQSALQNHQALSFQAALSDHWLESPPRCAPELCFWANQPLRALMQQSRSGKRRRGVRACLPRISTAICRLGWAGQLPSVCLSARPRSCFVSCVSTPSHSTTQRALTEWRRSVFPVPPKLLLSPSCTYLPIWRASLTSFPLFFAISPLCHISLGRFHIQSQHACITRGLFESPPSFWRETGLSFLGEVDICHFHTRNNNTPPRLGSGVKKSPSQLRGVWRKVSIYTRVG